ncbi:MAG: hypothetical protein V4615_09965 [Bacteroidota bacterium]
MKNICLLPIVIGLIVALTLFHFVSLALYPIPWVDETFFASVSRDLLQRGKFFPFIAPINLQFNECFTYGPVYFLLQAFLFKCFSFSSYVARLAGFIAGLFMCFALYKTFTLDKKESNLLAWLLIGGVLFDFSVFESFHSGRMETLALAFVFGYIYFILKNEKVLSSKTLYFNAMLYSFFAVLATLTTPRASILLVAPGMILLYRLIKERRIERFVELIILSSIFMVVIVGWIYYAFGTLHSMIEYYRMVNQPFDFLKGFAFNTILVYQYPVILLSLLAVVATIIICKRKFFSPINFISLVSIFLFYILVNMYRPYGIYVMVYFYLLFAQCIYMIQKANPDRVTLIVSSMALYGLVGIMVLTTVVKAGYIIDSYSERKSDSIDSFISKNIPKGSKVIGDEVYYFSVLKAGSDFQYIKWGDSDQNREKYQRVEYDYDYILMSDVLLKMSPQIFSVYQKNADLIIINRFNAPLSSITSYFNAHRPGLVFFYSYNGILYQRIKTGKI